jgi:ADP-ribose pyrophosphatase YjhB (NUDIX family)
LRFQAPQVYDCPDCALHLYRNPAVAVAGIVLDSEKKVLLIRRGRAPALGKLALPGGFVDLMETAEAALRRELREELGLELASIRFLMSHPNQYSYREVTYDVLDLFFVCETRAASTKLLTDEVTSAHWLQLEEFDLEELAFPSMTAALKFLKEQSA